MLIAMVKIDDCVTQSKSQLFNQKQTSRNMILVGTKYAFVPWHSSLFRIVLLPDAAEDIWLTLCVLQNTKTVSPCLLFPFCWCPLSFNHCKSTPLKFHVCTYIPSQHPSVPCPDLPPASSQTYCPL